MKKGSSILVTYFIIFFVSIQVVKAQKRDDAFFNAIADGKSNLNDSIFLSSEFDSQPQGWHEIVLPSETLANGLYFLTVEKNNEKSVKKIMIQK